MKYLLSIIVAAFLFSACKKKESELPANTWTINGKTFTANWFVHYGNGLNFTAVDTTQPQRCSIEFNFNQGPPPTTSRDVQVVGNRLQINVQYNGYYTSTGYDNSVAHVNIENNKLHITMNNVRVKTFFSPLDSTLVSCNIIEP